MDRKAIKNSPLFKNWGTFSKGMDTKSIQLGFASHLEYSLSKDKYTATLQDLYHSLALTARDRLSERWIRTQQIYYDNDVKRVYYLSAEYLIGRVLINNLISLGMYEQTRQAMKEVNINLDELAECEPDQGLGNGGLGRLAACYMDSLATLEIPAYGYGIRYEFGIFEQVIRHCQQYEVPEIWLKFGNPWEMPHPEYAFTVKFYGETRDVNRNGEQKVEWVNTSDVIGTAYDTPIDGYDNNTVNTLRLWSARASKEFDLQYFQHGDYFKAVEEKYISENISKVLYPNDDFLQGQELRLRQQYFFVSCSIQDIIRRYLITHRTFNEFSDKVAIQMNDTHPALAVVELMRLLIDHHGLSWKDAWEITAASCAYTNHTLLSEALERWPVSMFGRLLPRHLQIIYEINRRFLREVSVHFVGDNDRLSRMSLIEETPVKSVRMANLAIVGSHSVNGVSKLHSRLLREQTFNDFEQMFPGRFKNITNGVTPRRWLYAANPTLSALITERIGNGWVKDLDQLRQLEPAAKDPAFQQRFNQVKRKNKEMLCAMIKEICDCPTDPESIFDVQVKRIHEYKRQLLNILHVVHLWLRIKEDPHYEIFPRTFIFGGKAAPGYRMAKLIIRLICQIAEVINKDSETNQKLKVVFLPNYRVSLAERIFPASDVSEQISTAGFEASGTGNMKFCLNGAIIVGTLDGANIEIMEEVGEENIFIFGLTAEEVMSMRSYYQPLHFLERDPVLKRVIELISGGFFCPEEPDVFKPIVEYLTGIDRYMVMADFEAYRDIQNQIGKVYSDRSAWTEMAIKNVCRMGNFSSDRAIAEYNRNIWKATPLSVTRDNEKMFGVV